jgi:hypothetical protein
MANLGETNLIVLFMGFLRPGANFTNQPLDNADDLLLLLQKIRPFIDIS